MNASPPADWQQVNARYLSAALAWLRHKLEAQARRAGHAPQRDEEARHQPLPAVPPAQARRHWWARGAESMVTVEVPPRLPPPANDDEYARAEAEYRAAGQERNPPPMLVRLAEMLGLSAFERETLLLCAAMEIDPAIAGLCERAQGHGGRHWPTFALALTLFDGASWEALTPQRPLRYWRLLEIHQAPGQPLVTSALSADERIVHFIQGIDYLDDRLALLMRPLDTAAVPDLPGSWSRQVDDTVQQLHAAAPSGRLPLVQLLGTDSTSKRIIAGQAARALGLHLYRLTLADLPDHAHDLETLQRLWQRESLMVPLALFLDAGGGDSRPGANAGAERLLAGLDSVCLLDTQDAWQLVGRDSIQVDVLRPTTEEQESAWSAALSTSTGGVATGLAARLASQFSLGIEDIRRVCTTASGGGPGSMATEDQVWNACLALTRPRLDQLAQRLEPKAGWDDLVLPAAQTALLRQIAAQVDARGQVYRTWGFADRMSRGLGISALFAGDSGTGKTMAAEVIARALQLNLYRIDLSAVVSKYIGETEKNLRRLFDAADDGGAILFFDEADALFGKRSEVKDSHDRYANIEINYLLQRMEAYRGLAILATNLKSALDQAFLRRLRFVVDFPFPAQDQRRTMWQKVFPPRTPTRDLDVAALARLNLTGGNIHSIALNAAFVAARDGGPVTQQRVMDAARGELRKLGRVVNELEFRSQGLGGTP